RRFSCLRLIATAFKRREKQSVRLRTSRCAWSALRRPHRFQLVDGRYAAAVEMKRIVLRLPAVAQQPGAEHCGAQAALGAHAAVEHAVAAFLTQKATELPARTVLVRVVTLREPAHIDQPRIEVYEIQPQFEPQRPLARTKQKVLLMIPDFRQRRFHLLRAVIDAERSVREPAPLGVEVSERRHDRRSPRTADAVLLRHERELARLFTQAIVGHRLQREDGLEVFRRGDAVEQPYRWYAARDDAMVRSPSLAAGLQ